MSTSISVDASLRKIQSTGSVVQTILQDGIFRRLSLPVPSQASVTGRTSDTQPMEWGHVLSNFSAVAEHSEYLWKNIDTSLAFYAAVPSCPTANHTEGTVNRYRLLVAGSYIDGREACWS